VGFIAWFPVRLAKNFAWYLGGFSAYFLARWLGLLALDAYPEYREQVGVAELAFSLACLLAMTVSIRRQGESETVMPGHSWSATEMERLARQLDAINASLARPYRSG
jgi:hypothetical protein